MIESYDLNLDVGFREGLIKGSVTIHAYNIGDSFDLDAKDMAIASVSVNGRPISFTYDESKSIVHVSAIPSGDTTIVVEYEKRISDKASTGVYKARYGADYFIATDLWPDQAKEFFPCKDDPAWKAIFNLRVTTDADLKVISNSPVSRVEDAGSGTRKCFIFEPTAKMSTYLLFMGVGKFSETKAIGAHDEPEVILASRPGTSDKAGFILEVASDVLRESSKYFGVPYPLKKLHLVALPEYLGAMENWGAITSYEGGLLIGKSASAFDRKTAAINTAHEIQHQWLGDLVTMKWWNDIWLNESFATFMSYKVMDVIRPQWSCWSDFLGQIGFESMRADQLRATHPIQAKLEKPSQITEVMDQISYSKGASVIRMVEAFLGSEVFRGGISTYIRQYSYSNATSEDLWNTLERTSTQPVGAIMGAWVTKSGFPLVSVSKQGDKLVFRQKRFTLGGEADDDATWPIPVTLQLSGEQKKFLFKGKTQEMSLEGERLSQLKVNAGQTGYYCVKYDSELYELLAAEFAALDGIDKSGIMNDLFQLLKADELDPDVYVKFVRLCRNVEDYSTSLTVYLQLRLLYSIADNSKSVREMSLEFLNAQLERLGLSRKEEDPETDGLLRAYVVAQLARMDDGFAGRLAGKFEEYESVDPNLKQGVAIAYARTRGKEAFDRLLDLVTKTEDETERADLYAGLAAVDDPTLITQAIELSASGRVSRSDLLYTLVYGAFNPRAHQPAWSWIKQNYERVWECFGQPAFVLGVLAESVPQIAVENVQDAIEFFSGERLAKGEMSHRQNLELASVYARLRNRLALYPPD